MSSITAQRTVPESRIVYGWMVLLTGTYHGALLLARLIQLYNRFKIQTGSEEFYQQDRRLMAWCFCGSTALAEAKNKLKKLEIISWEKKGVPAKCWYQINWEKLEELEEKYLELANKKFVAVDQCTASRSTEGSQITARRSTGTPPDGQLSTPSNGQVKGSVKEGDEREGKGPAPSTNGKANGKWGNGLEVLEDVEIDEDGFERKVLKKDREKPIERWSSEDFRRYLAEKYQDAYRKASWEFELNKKRGVIVSKIKKQLLEKMTGAGYPLEEIRNYIDWVFLRKKDKNIDFRFLTLDSLIQEWINKRNPLTKEQLAALGDDSDEYLTREDLRNGRTE